MNPSQEGDMSIHGYEPCFSTIPVIDLHLLLSASTPTESKQQEMDKLKSALIVWGCFQAIGHGISDSLLDDVRNLSKEFFSFPLEEKRKYSVEYDSEDYGRIQGYGNDQIILEGQYFDRSDRLNLLVKPQEQRKTNLWPEYPKQFREALHEYSIKITSLAENIVKAMEKLLSLEDDCFVNQFGDQGPIFARFNYYPPSVKPVPHTDGTGLTILLQDKDVQGLQVLKDDEWVKVPTIPYALVINLGDQLEIMSNGIFKSVVHQVEPDSGKERISLAMFYSPYINNEIGPADGLIDETRPRLYKTMKFKDYVRIFIEQMMQGKTALDYVKV